MATSSTASLGRRTWAIIPIIATVASIGIVTPVAAAAPSNDDRGAATVVGSVPFTDSTDTSEATSQPADPNDCGFSGEDDATVWYSFTPAQAGAYVARTAGSEYDTTLILTAKTEDGLEFMDCSDDANGMTSAIVWQAAAGQEYLLMVGGCCPGDRGPLRFSIATPPSRPTIRFSLGSPARLTSGGAIALHGRVNCQHVGRARVSLNVRQDQGLRIVRGQRSQSFPCGGRWSLRVANFDFRFNRSDISVVASARAWNISGSRSRTIRRTLDVD